jgi:preprotein translocase subunit SecG
MCGSGGTGRHTILRGWRRKAWGFKSPLPHQNFDSTNERKAGTSRLDSDRMHIVIGLIYTVHILVCFFLIVVVLLQSGKSGDIAAAFGGMGSQTAFGPRGAATALSKATTWSAVLFMVTSITLSIFAVRRSGTQGSGSVLSGVKGSTTNSQPAAPAKTPPSPASQPAPAK